MKKLLVILAFLLPFTMVSMAQVDGNEAQLFGSKRPTSAYNSHNFGEITAVVQHEFMIYNTSPAAMTIISFQVPDGFNVFLYDKTIEPKSSAKFLVTVDPEHTLIEGDFAELIIITTEQETHVGKIVKEHSYTVQGKL